MAAVSQVDVLDQIFAGLKSKAGETRLASAVELQQYVRIPLHLVIQDDDDGLENNIGL